MLDPKVVRSSPELIAKSLKSRGYELDVTLFERLETSRKTLQTKIQDLQNERNNRSKAIGIAKAQGQATEHLMEDLKILREEITARENEFSSLQTELSNFQLDIPNLPHESVPVGTSEKDNEVVSEYLSPTKFDFKPKDHVELGAERGIDFETAAKLSGSRFVVLKKEFARLHRALAQFMLDTHVKEHGYEEVTVPFLVNAECLEGTGQLPKFKDDLFETSEERYLIPTAEVPMTNFVRDEIIAQERLPLRYVSFSSCFRSEAGSYGKDIRGMLRQHQFEKVELVQIVHPQHSYDALEQLTHDAEMILQKLNLPYRKVLLCTADLGFASAKTYDLEVWLPGQSCYREISSCSNMEAFQARRMKARFRDPSGKIDWVHTLNGSGLAVGRTFIAVVENNQDALGRIHIPAVLQKYMDGITVIE